MRKVESWITIIGSFSPTSYPFCVRKLLSCFVHHFQFLYLTNEVKKKVSECESFIDLVQFSFCLYSHHPCESYQLTEASYNVMREKLYVIYLLWFYNLNKHNKKVMRGRYFDKIRIIVRVEEIREKG